MRRPRVVTALVVVVALAAAAGCGGGGGDESKRVDGPGAQADEPEDRVPGTEIMRLDYETGDLSQWDGAQAVSDDRIQVVEDPVEQGRYAGRFEVREGDNPIDENDRAEVQVSTGEAEGDERWYGWSMMFGEDFPASDGFQVVMQWRPSEAAGPPSVGFYVEGDELLLKTNPYDAEDVPARLPEVIWRGPLERGRWRQFELHARWSASDQDGFLELWIDGERVTERVYTRTLYPGETAYLKQGYYREAGIHEPGVVFHDGLRISEVGGS